MQFSLQYSIEAPPPAYFTLDPNSGNITLFKSLFNDDQMQYTVSYTNTCLMSFLNAIFICYLKTNNKDTINLFNGKLE